MLLFLKKRRIWEFLSVFLWDYDNIINCRIMLLCLQKLAEQSHNDITNQSKQNKYISDAVALL